MSSPVIFRQVELRIKEFHGVVPHRPARELPRRCDRGNGVTSSPALRRPLGTAGMGNHARLAGGNGCTMLTAWDPKKEMPVKTCGPSAD